MGSVHLMVIYWLILTTNLTLESHLGKVSLNGKTSFLQLARGRVCGSGLCKLAEHEPEEANSGVFLHGFSPVTVSASALVSLRCQPPNLSDPSCFGHGIHYSSRKANWDRRLSPHIHEMAFLEIILRLCLRVSAVQC